MSLGGRGRDYQIHQLVSLSARFTHAPNILSGSMFLRVPHGGWVARCTSDTTPTPNPQCASALS
jgi:hypothetical protein